MYNQPLWNHQRGVGAQELFLLDALQVPGLLPYQGTKRKPKNLRPRVSGAVSFPSPLPSEDNLVVSSLHQCEGTGMWVFMWSAELSERRAICQPGSSSRFTGNIPKAVGTCDCSCHGAMRHDRGLPEGIGPLDGSPRISMVGPTSGRSAGSAAGLAGRELSSSCTGQKHPGGAAQC